MHVSTIRRGTRKFTRGFLFRQCIAGVIPRWLSMPADRFKTEFDPNCAVISPSKIWLGNVDPEKFFCSAPESVEHELHQYIKKQVPSLTHRTLDNNQADTSLLSETSAFLRDIESSYLVNGPGAAIFQPIKGLESILEIRLLALTLSQLMGDCLKQNSSGERSILVFDRDATRRMVDGQRYHQSHEGGSLHTDNVNIPECWEFMLLTCLQPAMIGGENILVSAVSVFEYFQKHDPDVLLTLAKDFWWEYRGFSDGFFRAPILFYNRSGEPCFRWLREYMESAHHRLAQPFTPEQQHALDSLTNITLDPHFQFHYSFRKGQILFANDLQLFHGRTAFRDAQAASSDYDFSHPVNRLMQRNWVQTTSSFRGINQSKFCVPTTEEIAGLHEDPESLL